MTNTSPAVSATERPQPLRLPQVNLPSFTGEQIDDLERFLQQLTTLLISSGVPSRHYVTYLKQQIQKDARAYDAVSQAEEQHANILHTDHDSSPSHKAYLDYFNAIKEALIQKRGKPKDEKVRELLHQYYNMVQGRDETVSQFAHRFLEIQHSSEKLIPNIHYTPDKKDTELLLSFAEVILLNWEPLRRRVLNFNTHFLSNSDLTLQNILRAVILTLNPFSLLSKLQNDMINNLVRRFPEVEKQCMLILFAKIKQC